MPNDSIASTVGVALLSALMLILSYLFYREGESVMPLILLFVGIVLALTLAKRVVGSK